MFTDGQSMADQANLTFIHVKVSSDQVIQKKIRFTETDIWCFKFE